MSDARLVQRAAGLLQTFNTAGVLAAADVHVALRLERFGGEASEPVLLAAALAVRAVRLGSVCVDLHLLRQVTVDEQLDVDVDALPWPPPAGLLAGLRASPLVGPPAEGGLQPLRLVETAEGELLYLDRYFRQEQTIRRLLDERAAGTPAIDVATLSELLRHLFVDSDGAPSAAPDRQRVAAALVATGWTTVVAGGPGTGKTHTVARVLAVLRALHGPGLRIALAAPTGRAAARLQDSVRGQAAALGLPGDLTASTLHRLLGWRPGSSSRFRHDSTNHLPYDVVVVDETSMVSLTMMARLLEAVRPDARLVLVGDPDQLASVDAGAVLADLVARPVAGPPGEVLAGLVGADLSARDDPEEAALTDRERSRLRGGVVRLSRGRRFGGAIADLAVAVRDGDGERAVELLRSGDTQLSWVQTDDLDALRQELVACALDVTRAATEGNAGAALDRLEAHRLLCAHRHGPYGVGDWGRTARGWVERAAGRLPDPGSWYPGQPLLATVNDHEAKVYNGDIGVVVRRDDGSLVAAFGRSGAPVLLHPSRLSSLQTVYAMTIHRSQGSQYDAVSVLLPPARSALLTRELLYTAITRARHRVRVVGTEESVRAGVERQVLRASGLRRALP